MRSLQTATAAPVIFEPVVKALQPAARSPLARVIAEFNGVFHYAFALPMCREDLLAVARLAESRGRDDIATELRRALEASC